MGIVDFGRGYYAKITVQEATQEALAYVAHFPVDTAGARLRGSQSSSGLNILTSKIVISCPSATTVKVTTSHDLPMITPIVAQMVGGPMNLSFSQSSTVFSATPCVPAP